MKEKDQKHYLANLADKLAKGKIGRRDFLRKAAKLGLSMSALGRSGPPAVQGASRDNSKRCARRDAAFQPM